MSEQVTINLTGVSALGHHGVFDFEKEEGQVFIVDACLTVSCDTTSDQLAGTLDYGAVATAIERRVTGEPFNLIETLAARIADDLVAFDRLIEAAVTVHKPDAPAPTPFTDVSVTLTRRKHGH